MPFPEHRGDADGPFIKRGPVPAFIGLAVLAALWSLRSGTPDAAKPTAGELVIAFGDSLVEGVGASAGRDVVAVILVGLSVGVFTDAYGKGYEDLARRTSSGLVSPRPAEVGRSRPKA